ncbi:hypothetical protein J4Q44_G00080970 [Coregonus suidteri]|uniref:Fibromodulin n=1 Tax=Coregonus suidteri TaxID=861788 RepID=A0AAN8N1G4_9TELE
MAGRTRFSGCPALHGRGYAEGSLLADTTGGSVLRSVTARPPSPSLWYCDGRGLTTMPTVPSRMKYLYLQHNEITALPDSALANATNLVWVMLHHNALSTDKIGKRAFAKLQGLNNNNINKIMPEALEGMDNLTILGNKLKKVPDSLPERIHQLYLESNAISAVPEGFLSKFSQLQYIRMGHNQLTDKGIPPNTFNVTGLVELDLSFKPAGEDPPRQPGRWSTSTCRPTTLKSLPWVVSVVPWT